MLVLADRKSIEFHLRGVFENASFWTIHIAPLFRLWFAFARFVVLMLFQLQDMRNAFFASGRWIQSLLSCSLREFCQLVIQSLIGDIFTIRKADAFRGPSVAEVTNETVFLGVIMIADFQWAERYNLNPKWSKKNFSVVFYRKLGVHAPL